MLGGFCCMVECDVLGAFTKGCQAQVDEVVHGCHRKGSFIIRCPGGGNGIKGMLFCGGKFHQSAGMRDKGPSVMTEVFRGCKHGDLVGELRTGEYR